MSTSVHMELRDELLREHSKAQALKIADWIGDDAGRFSDLLTLFLQDEYRVVQRAAWIISLVAEKRPRLIGPHLPVLVGRMDEPGLPVAVKRNILRLLQHVNIPERLHGPVMNIAFRLLESPGEPVAVHAFAMSVLAGLAKTYPEIRGELRLIIEDTLAGGTASAGYRARAGKVLKSLGKT